MASIFFKRGLRENLQNAQLRDGTIYVTTDERAMYVDCYDDETSQVKRIRLGDFFEYASWSDIQDIPVTDLDRSALYYAQEENILCKWTGVTQGSDTNGWIQINAQQSLREMIKTIGTIASSITNGTKVTTHLYDYRDQSQASGEVSFVSANGTKLKIAGSTTNGKATVTFTPEAIVESNSLSVETDANDNTSLVLTNLRTGTDATGTAVNESSDVKLSLIGQGIELYEEDGALVIKNLGGIANNGLTNAFDQNGNYRITITTSNNTTIQSAAIMPKIRYGQTTTDAVFANGVAILDVYTKSEVDDKIATEMKAANAMTFKGSVGTEAGSVSADLPTTGVKNGDVYLVSSEDDYGNGTFTDCMIGDMFVATGTEGTDGTIPAANLVWVYIPSGNDIPASYSFRYNNTNHTIEFVNTVGNAVAAFAAGSDIVLSAVQGGGFTISHATVTRTNTTAADAEAEFNGSDFELDVITGITTSDTGHVTGVEKTKLIIDDIHNAVSAVGVAATRDATTGNAKVTVSVTDREGTHSDTFQLHSESLTFSASGKTTNIEMEWGSF